MSRIHHLKKIAMKCSAHRTADKEKKKVTCTRCQEKETPKNPYPGKDYEKKNERINWKSTEARRRRASGGRPESEGSTRQRNIRIKDTEEEGSPSRSELEQW